MTSNGSSDLEKKTAGEELFLVHLSRAEATGPDPADFDRETSSGSLRERRRRGSSFVMLDNDDEEGVPTPGEELWKVHCKRCEGSELDYDEEVGPLEDAKAVPSTPRPSTRNGKSNKKVKHEDGGPQNEQGRVLHLRSRDVALH
jgi:hypothetical protein